MADLQEYFETNIHGLRVPYSPFINDGRKSRIMDGRYEGQELSAGQTLIREGDTILELGAGLGIVGATLTYITPKTQLYSFEANAALVPHISKLYDINQISDRAKVQNKVVLTSEDPPEKIDFHVYDCFLGSSLIDSPRKTMPVVSVNTIHWSTICSEISPNVLLIDIEGGELEFLEQADLSCLRAVVIEFHPDRYGAEGEKRCKEKLVSAGFSRVEGISSRLVWGAERTS